MNGDNVTKEEWKEVERIVKDHQRSLLATFNNKDKERYNQLKPILDELYKYAHGEHGLECPPCDPQAVVCRDHLTDE